MRKLSYCLQFVDVETILYPYTIGAGGAAGSAGNYGLAGGDTTFTANGITYTAYGGPAWTTPDPPTPTSGSGTGAAVYYGGMPVQYVANARAGGGSSIFGLSGGRGSYNSISADAGYPGKIILELYK